MIQGSYIGEIKRASEIGRFRPRDYYIWSACESCGKQRWVKCVKGAPRSSICKSCSITKLNTSGKNRGADNPRWKGGKRKNGDYIAIHLFPNDKFYSMVDSNHDVLEHRLLMAKHLGRLLLRSEHVHHINGIKDDNRIENLQLLSQADHNIRIQLCRDCELRKEIRLLRWEFKELKEALQIKLRMEDS